MEKFNVQQFLNDPVKGKEVIRKGLEQDLKCAIYTLNEVLKTPDMFDAYAESVWTRYVAFYEKEKAQVKMDFESNGNGHGK